MQEGGDIAHGRACRSETHAGDAGSVRALTTPAGTPGPFGADSACWPGSSSVGLGQTQLVFVFGRVPSVHACAISLAGHPS